MLNEFYDHQLIKWYSKIAFVVIFSSPILALILYLILPYKNDKIYNCGVVFDSENSSSAVAFRKERSTKFLFLTREEIDLMNEFDKHQFVNDSLMIKQGDTIKIIEYNKDSTVVRIKLYDDVIRKYSKEVYILSSSIKFLTDCPH